MDPTFVQVSSENRNVPRQRWLPGGLWWLVVLWGIWRMLHVQEPVGKPIGVFLAGWAALVQYRRYSFCSNILNTGKVGQFSHHDDASMHKCVERLRWPDIIWETMAAEYVQKDLGDQWQGRQGQEHQDGRFWPACSVMWTSECSVSFLLSVIFSCFQRTQLVSSSPF